MTVAFWSNTRGKSCVTSNLACMSVLSTLGSLKDDRTILLENHQNVFNLGSVFVSQNSKKVVREQGVYRTESGLSHLLRMLEWDKAPTEEVFHYIAKGFLGERLLYLSAEGAESADVLEYKLEKEYSRAISYLEEKGHLVMIDTSSAPLPSSRKILQDADLVVVNLSQNRQMLEHFFYNFSDIRSKAFYLIGDYDEGSDWTKSAIAKEFGVSDISIGTIPHSTSFANAISEGKVIPFLLHNYDCVPESSNYSFIKTSREAAGLLRKCLSECGEK